MHKLITALKVFVTFSLVLGLGYPLLLVAIAKVVFPGPAAGSQLSYQGKVIGSQLIAQEFTLPKYFHARPSTIGYNAEISGENNLAASSVKLYQRTKRYMQLIRLENNLPAHLNLPADMVLSSASGLDPHISLANAIIQLERVAKHRELSRVAIRKLIEDVLEPSWLRIWGSPRINVLRLNLALDQLEKINYSESL